jgi:hypothetical protein
MIEPKIGKPFKYEGKWYVARRAESVGSCEGCFKALEDYSQCRGWKCMPYKRSDCESVIYVPTDKPGHRFSRLYDWFWSDDPIAQRFRIGYAVVVILGLAGCVFGIGLLAGRGGM